MRSAKVLMSGLSGAALAALACSIVGGMTATGMAVGAQQALEVIADKPSRRTGSKPKQQPRKDSQLRLQAAEAKRDRRALRNLRIKARGGFGR